MYKESVFSDLFLHFTFRILILQCKEKMRKRLRVFEIEDRQIRKRKMPKALLKIDEHPSQHTNVFYTFKLGINSFLNTFFRGVELYVLRVLNVCSMFEFPLNMGY